MLLITFSRRPERSAQPRGRDRAQRRHQHPRLGLGLHQSFPAAKSQASEAARRRPEQLPHVLGPDHGLQCQQAVRTATAATGAKAAAKKAAEEVTSSTTTAATTTRSVELQAKAFAARNHGQLPFCLFE
jgi:hypothetical protein